MGVKRILSEILRRGSESAVGEGWWREHHGRWGGKGGGGCGAGGGRGGGGGGGGAGGGGERLLLLAFLLFHYHSGRHAGEKFFWGLHSHSVRSSVRAGESRVEREICSLAEHALQVAEYLVALTRWTESTGLSGLSRAEPSC